MSDTPAMPYDYQSEGGALLLDAPTYVKRHADDDLYEGLKAGQFCYVLNARQMGKSSLKVRTLQRLRDEGIACAAVDLQGIGTSATEEQWYFGIISRIARSLGLHRQFNLNTWWTEQPRLSYVQRFVEFLESLLLPAIAEPIVVFIDEVDLTLNLAFRDDFFGALRESYNRRADEPEYRRLTFALFGVTTPSDLIQNKQTTPFNIGRPVDLTGLHLEEAQPLIPGLVAKASNPQALLQAVLDWTGGQPFLTQKLCKLVQSAESTPSDGQEHLWVGQLVQAKVIDNWEAQDIPPHLKTIRDRLLLSGEQRTGRLLGLYQQIVQQGEVAADDSPEQMTLRLTGLVVRRDGKLRVYNRIYEQVFNGAWLERELAELRPYGVAIAVWLESDHQDESRLLRGQALQDARTWAEGKSLGDDDRRFLDASQEIEKRDIQKKLEAEAEANQILIAARQSAESELVSANQRLSEAEQETNAIVLQGRRVRLITSMVAGLTVLIAAGAFGFAVHQGVVAKGRTEDAQRANEKLAELNPKLAETQSKLTDASTKLVSSNTKLTDAEAKLADANQKSQSAEARRQDVEQKAQDTNQKLSAAEAKRQTIEEALTAAQGALVTIQKAAEKTEKSRQAAELEGQKLAEVNRLEQSANAHIQVVPEKYLSALNSFESEKLMIKALELGEDLKNLSQQSGYSSQISSLKYYSQLKSSFLLLRIAVNLPLLGNYFLNEQDSEDIAFGPSRSRSQILAFKSRGYAKVDFIPTDSEIEPVGKEEDVMHTFKNEMYHAYKIPSRTVEYKGNFRGFSPSIKQLFFFTKSDEELFFYSVTEGLIQKFKGEEFNSNSSENTIELLRDPIGHYQISNSWKSFFDTGLTVSNRFRFVVSRDSLGGMSTSFGMVIPDINRDKPEIRSSSFIRGISEYVDRKKIIVSTYSLSSEAFLSTLEGDFIDFSPHKDFFLVSNGNRSQLYKPSGKAVAEFADVHGVFIPEQERLFTTLDYGVTRLYDFSGNVLAEFPGSYLMMSPDGKFLITSLRNGERRLWRVDNGLDDLLARGCNWLRPYLKLHPEDLKRLKVCQVNK